MGEPKKVQKQVDVQEGNGNNFYIWFFLAILGFSVYLSYKVFAPFIHSFILACVFSALSYPIYQFFLAKMSRKTWAALSVLVLITIVVAIPVTFFIAGLVPQAVSSVKQLNQWLAGQHLSELISTHIDPVLAWVDVHIPEFDVQSFDIKATMMKVSSKVGENLVRYGYFIMGNIANMAMHFVLILCIMFYLLINGERVLRRVMYLSPLRPHQTAVVIERMRRTSKAVFGGGLALATLQGIVGGIGLAIVGVPALFWGTVMAFAALVPVVGTGLVWVPAVIFLFLTGETGYAIFLLVWCAGIVCSLDTFLRPFLLRDGVKVPVVFLFLSILGGVQAFGMLGLLYGPMILALLAVMLTIYGEEYHVVISSHHNGKTKGSSSGQ